MTREMLLIATVLNSVCPIFAALTTIVIIKLTEGGEIKLVTAFTREIAVNLYAFTLILFCYFA